jgi:hypothetical protein
MLQFHFLAICLGLFLPNILLLAIRLDLFFYSMVIYMTFLISTFLVMFYYFSWINSCKKLLISPIINDIDIESIASKWLCNKISLHFNVVTYAILCGAGWNTKNSIV